MLSTYQQLFQTAYEVVDSLLQVNWIIFGRLNTKAKAKNTVCYSRTAFYNITELLLGPTTENKKSKFVVRSEPIVIKVIDAWLSNKY